MEMTTAEVLKKDIKVLSNIEKGYRQMNDDASTNEILKMLAETTGVSYRTMKRRYAKLKS